MLFWTMTFLIIALGLAALALSGLVHTATHLVWAVIVINVVVAIVLGFAAIVCDGSRRPRSK